MKILFCDRCDKAIPQGQANSSFRGKIRCLKCAGYMTFMWRLWVVTVIVGIGTLGQMLRNDYIDRDKELHIEVVRRFEFHSAGIGSTIQYLFAMESELKESISKQESGMWDYINRVVELRKDLELTKQQIEDRIRYGVDDMDKMENANVALIERVYVLENQAKRLRREFDSFKSIDPKVMNNALRSVVCVSIRDKNDLYKFGSGVLFKRVQENGQWIYYGFTAYHVFHEMLEVQEREEQCLLEQDKIHPIPVVLVYDSTSRLRHTDEIKVVLVHDKKVRPIIDIEKVKSQDDYCVFTFKSKKKYAVSELASNDECRSLRTGDPVVGMGIHPVMRPAAYMGAVASLYSVSSGTMAVHTMAWPGMSGAPIFNRNTMKVIGLVQSMSTWPGVGGNVNVAYCQPLHRILKKHRLSS